MVFMRGILSLSPPFSADTGLSADRPDFITWSEAWQRLRLRPKHPEHAPPPTPPPHTHTVALKNEDNGRSCGWVGCPRWTPRLEVNVVTKQRSWCLHYATQRRLLHGASMHGREVLHMQLHSSGIIHCCGPQPEQHSTTFVRGIFRQWSRTQSTAGAARA